MQANTPLTAQDFANMDAQISARENMLSPSHQSMSQNNTAPFQGGGMMSGIGNAIIGAGNDFYNSAVGAGDALKNTITAPLNALPGVNISPAQNGQGAAYNIGKSAGNIGGFVGGGEVLDSLRLAAEGLPYIGQAAQYLGGTGIAQGIARRALGTGLYGAAENPNNRTGAAGIGAASSVAADSILPPAFKAVGAAANYLMPQKYAQGIVQNLGGGQTLEDATKSVLGSVKGGYDNAVANSTAQFSPITDQVGNQSIYAPPKSVYGIPTAAPTNTTTVSRSYSPVDYGNNPAWENQAGPSKSSTIIASGQQNPASFLEGNYPNISQNLTDNYTGVLQDMHNNFINNPTFGNAHALQSELGATQRQLQSGIAPPTIGTLNSINALGSARNALKSDMTNFLAAKSPQLADEYQAASDGFLNNVVPYRTNPKIYSIATGDTTNIQPSSLGNIFKSPDSNMQKVISDMPSSAIDKILFTKLGQTVPQKSAQGLLNKYNDLDQQGLASYASPELQSSISSLQNRIKARNSLQTLGQTALGAMGGSSFGPMGAAIGAGAGLGTAAVTNPFMNYLAPRLPLSEVGQAITNFAKKSYNPAKTAVLANSLNNSSSGAQ